MSKKTAHPALERLCLFFIKSGIYLSLFTPFVVNQRSFFPFVTPKTIYFRILIEIVFAFYLILAISTPRYRPKPNGVLVAVSIFISILILTSFLGVNFERSFWSVYERMTGIFTFLHLLAFFLVLTTVFRDSDSWKKLLAVSVLSGVFICVSFLTTNQVSSRGGGTIGNTSFLAAYLLFDVFFALFLFLENKNTGWRIFSGVSLLLLVPVLLMSTARGAIMSFYLGLFLLFLGYLFFSGKKNFKTAAIILILFPLFLIALLAFYQPSFVTSKIAQLSMEMKPRFVVWETGWKGFLERPIFGWGPENFNIVFNKFFNPCMFTSECGGEIWFDRAHNIVLDILVTSGLVGFIAYLSIFAVSIFNLLKICAKHKEKIFVPLTMIVLLIIYFLHNMLVFDMISSYVVFFLTLSFISFLIEEDREPFWGAGQNLTSGFLYDRKKYVISFVIAFLTVIFLYYGNIQPYLSARNIVNMIVLAESLQDVSGYFNKTLNTYMYKYEIREQFAQKVYQESLISGYPNNIGLFFDSAEREMQKSIEDDPIDFRPRLFLGRTYLAHYRINPDRDILDLAEKTLQEAAVLSPDNQQSYWYLAETELFKNNYESSYDLFKKAIDLEPKYGKSYWFLAMAYKITGRYELAFAELQKAEKYGYNWKDNIADLMSGVDIYKTVKGEQVAVEILEVAVKATPDKADLWAYLAASYANLGKLDKAREAALKVSELNPDLLPKVEQFLKDIEAE